MDSRILIPIILSWLFSFSAFAGPLRTTYQAKIIKPDGTPLVAPSVGFQFTILDPTGSCILYVENYAAVNMIDSGGVISFTLGTGARSFPTSGTSQTFQDIFDNSTSTFNCKLPGVYNPVPTDNRKIVMQFNDGAGWQTLPAMTINAVPYAMYATKAEEAQKLNGKSDNDFVEYSTLANLHCQSNEAIKFNGVNFSCIPVVSSAGISSVTTSGSVLTTGGTASAPVISINVASMSSDGYLSSLDYAEFKAKLSASSSQIVSTLGFAPVSSSNVAAQIASSTLAGDVSGNPGSNTVDSVGGKTASEISASVDDTQAATSSATANTVVKRNASGNVSFNGISATTANLNYVDIYKPSSSFNIRLQAPTSLAANYTLVLPTASGTTGQVLSTDGSGNLSWIDAATGSVTSVSGTVNEITSTGGSTPTLGLANVGTAGTYYKVITDSKGRVTSGSTTLTLSDLPNNLLITTSNFAGDISGMISNITVNRIQGVSVTTTSLTTNDILQYDGSKYVNKNIPTCSGAQYLTFNGTSFTCVAVAGASGTITTISVTGPISSTGGQNPTLSIAQANSTTDGYLSSTDWNTFNNKQNATSSAIIATLGYVPASSSALGNYLSIANNLSDLSSSAAARANLGLGTLATANSIDLGSASATGIIADARLADQSSVVSGSQYTKVIVDGKGRVVSGAQLTSADVAAALGFTPQNSASSTAGTVTNVSSSNSYLTVSNATTTPTLTLNVGTSANTVAAGNDARFTDARTPTGAAGGDLSGTYPNPSVVKIQGVSISAITPTVAGQMLRYDGTQWIPNFVSMLDLRSNVTGMQSLSATCSASQTLTYNSATDSLACSNISIAASQVSGLGSFASANSIDLGSASAAGTLAAARLPSFSGDATSVSGSNVLTLSAVGAGVTSGSQYTKVTVDGKGRVVSGASLSASDVTAALGYTPGNASGSITSLNGSVSQTQSFANGTTGNAPAFNTANGVHTLNIPLASATGSVTAGLISNADYVNFSNKITSGAASIAQVLGYVPASSTMLGNYLTIANNLSDLSSSATARTNLGLGSFATANTIDLGSASSTGIIADARLADQANVVSGTQYTKVTLDGKGRVTSATQLTASDVTTALGYTPGNASGSVTSLNGSASQTQTFATGITGTVFNISTSNGIHTFNIPLAASSSVTAGLLSNADYLTFTNKLNSTSAAVIAALGYTPASSTALGNYLTIANNLSDLASATVARANLGLGLLATKSQIDLGSVDVSGTLPAANLSDSGVTASTYAKVTVDTKGRVTSGSQLTANDVTTALGYTPGNASGSITSFNGSVSQTQTFATGITGTVFNISTVNGVHTFNIPLAASSSVTAGLLSNTDYLTFTNKLNATSAAVIAALGYTPASSTALGSYLTIANNLSDLASATVARTNLGLGSLATLNFIDLSSTQASGTLAAARLPAFNGDATSVSGSNVLTLASVGAGVTSGSQYTKVTVDGKGRVVSGASLTSADVTAALGYTPGNASGSITSFNGSVSQTQTLANGTSGNAPTFATANGVHTLNIPLASATGSVTAGLISNTDYVNFNNKITSSAAAVAQVLGYVPAVSGAAGVGTLLSANNLSDLASSATARTNLGLGTLATANSLDLSTASATGIIADARLANQTGVTSGVQYTKVTVDGKGRVVSGAQLTSSDVTTALGFTPGSAASGVTSLNGSASQTQTFANGTTGTSPLFNTANGVHTLNIPLASAASVTAGLLSNADYVSFSNKITSSAASVAQVLGYIPAASGSAGVGTLLAANNLSDLASSATARTNLGLGTFATASTIDLGSASATGTLAAARLPALSGDVTSVSGSPVLTLANSGVSAATYTKVTVNAKGLVTSGSQLTNADVTTALGYAPVSASASSQWNTSGTTINYTTGNVGIGDVAPASLNSRDTVLSVGTGATNTMPGIVLKPASNYNTNSGWEMFLSTDAGLKNKFNLSNGTNTILTVNSSGQMGLNTAPSGTHVFDVDSKGVAGKVAIGAGDINGTGPLFYLGASAANTEAVVNSRNNQALAFYANNAEAVRIQTNGNVGIGTTSPGQKLDVNGNINVANGNSIILQRGAGTNRDVTFTNASSVDNIAMLSVYPAAGTNVKSDITVIPKGTGYASSNRASLEIFNQDFVADSTNFQFLTIRSEGTNYGIFSQAGGSASNLPIIFSATGADATGSPQLVVATNGNVGIGTTTPATKLSVSGGVQISMESAACAVSYAGTLRYNAGAVQFCDGSTWASLGVAGAGITNFNGSTSGTQSFAIGTTGNSPAFVTANGVHTLNIPLASATGSVTAGLISNADYVSFNSRITSSAASIAQVLGYTPASASALGSYLTIANNLSDLNSSATARTNLGLGTFATASTIDLGSASATGTLAAARLPAHSGDVTSVSGSPVLTLASVGAGVTSGSQYTKVTVDGKGRVTSGSQLTTADVTTALGYAPVSAAGSSQWTTSGSDIYYNTGKVGIGLTPTYKLDVVSSGSVARFATTAPASSSGEEVLRLSAPTAGATVGSGPYIKFEDSGTETGRIISTTESTGNIGMGFYTYNGSSAERLRISSTGLVGINTTNPGALLEARNTAAASTSGQETLRLRGNYSGASVGSGNSIDFVEEGTGNKAARIRGYTFAAASTGLAFDTGWATPATRMVIDNSGNVGIGTTSPSTKLSVSGGVQIAMESAACAVGLAGTIRYNVGSVQFCNGSTWTSFASGTVTSQWATSGTTISYTSGNVGIGTTNPTAGLTVATSGAASTPGLLVNGAWYTGGSAATTKPQLLIQPSNTTSSNWSTNGTALGVNAPSGFGGNLLDLQFDGTSVFSVNEWGVTSLSGGSWLFSGGVATVNTASSPLSPGTVLGEFDFSGLASDWSLFRGSVIKSVVTNPTVGAVTSSLSLQTMAAGTLADRITVSGANVGIGTTLPGAKLEVDNFSAADVNAAIIWNLPTDPTASDSNAFTASTRPTFTASSSVNTFANIAEAFPKVATGITKNGSNGAYWGSAKRNQSSGDANGTTSSLYGARLAYGHGSYAAISPVSTDVYGIYLMPDRSSGSITNMYDIFLSADTGAATVTNRYGIYQVGNNRNYFAGNIGVGTNVPAATLDVSGTIVSRATANASTSIDFSTGNLQYTSTSCGALTLNNMKSGGTYSLAVQGTGGGTCSFTAYTGNGTGSLTVKTGSVVLTQTASKHIIFSFMVMGSYVYVSAADGY